MPNSGCFSCPRSTARSASIDFVHQLLKVRPVTNAAPGCEATRIGFTAPSRFGEGIPDGNGLASAYVAWLFGLSRRQSTPRASLSVAVPQGVLLARLPRFVRRRARALSGTGVVGTAFEYAARLLLVFPTPLLEDELNPSIFAPISDIEDSMIVPWIALWARVRRPRLPS